MVDVTVQDALLSKTASVSTSCSKTTGSSKSPCLMYEPTTPPKYGSLNGTCQNIPCSIQEDYSSYDETTPSPKTSRWRCEEDDTPSTVLNVMGSQVFSQSTIPWYRSRNSVCPPVKGDCGWARWTKDWFCSIVHSCCNERISWLYKLSLSVRFKKGDCVWARWTEELIHRPLIPEAFFKEMPIAVKTERWKRSPDCRSHFVCLSIRATT